MVILLRDWVQVEVEVEIEVEDEIEVEVQVQCSGPGSAFGFLYPTVRRGQAAMRSSIGAFGRDIRPFCDAHHETTEGVA
ncbi:MAG TPA: hypothetical protein VKX28_05225 [Xanthobacteraceae bacterium]|nr:hypothetical protein [Xanthobacteraceae bacterium]